MKIFVILLMCLSCVAQRTTGIVRTSGSVRGGGAGTTAAAWAAAPETIPSICVTNGGFVATLKQVSQVFLICGTAASPRVDVATINSDGSWGTFSNVTGNLPSATSYKNFGVSSTGTVLLGGMNNPGASVNTVWYWNNSTSSPVWTQATGCANVGLSTVVITEYTVGDDGYMYYALPRDGTVCRSTTTAATAFAPMNSANTYYYYSGNGTGTPTTCAPGVTGLGGGGGAGTGCGGGVYQISQWTLGGVSKLWGSGEGGASAVDPAFTNSALLENYGTFPNYTGNANSLARSANTIMFLRTFNSNTQGLTRIDVATRTVTAVTSCFPRIGTCFSGPTTGGTLFPMNGTTWAASVNGPSSSIYLLLSADDGITWSDLTTTGSVPSGCATLANQGAATDHYVYLRATVAGVQGAAYCRYGPL